MKNIPTGKGMIMNKTCGDNCIHAKKGLREKPCYYCTEGSNFEPDPKKRLNINALFNDVIGQIQNNTKEVKKMESQSRFGIMEEFNAKKLEAKRKLDHLVALHETGVTTKDAAMNRLKAQLIAGDASYKQDFENWKSKKVLEIRFKETEHRREMAALEDNITEREGSYENIHKEWQAITENEIVDYEKDIADMELKNERDTKAQREEIELIDQAIQDLKDISTPTPGKD